MPEGEGAATKAFMYINNSGVGFSGVDFQIGLGMKKDRNPGALPSPEDIDLFVFMSPQHAKGLIQAFNQALEAYEKIYGEINITPNEEAMQKAMQKFQPGRI